MKKIFNFLIIITILAGIAGFAWNWQKNVYSKELLRLEIFGPSEITIGEEVEYVVRYKNKGDFRLDNPEFVFGEKSSPAGFKFNFPTTTRIWSSTHKFSDCFTYAAETDIVRTPNIVMTGSNATIQ